MEAELRGDRKLVGTPVMLGNGEEWIVPSVPLSDEGDKIADMMDNVSDENNAKVSNKESLHKYFDFMFTLLKANYPTLTKDVARSNGLFHAAMLSDFFEAAIGVASKNV